MSEHGGARRRARRRRSWAAQVVKMITRIAPIALRAHDELSLPDASGTPLR